MKENLTELVFILDKSGSMSGLEKDTIGGFNSFIKKQKEEAGEAILSTIVFSDRCDVLHDRVNIKEVKELTDKDYFASGCTALLDAIGYSIKHIMKVHNELNDEDKPSKTLFVIKTDGYENSSKEFSYPTIKKLIEERRESGWEFIFLGANIDSVKEAETLGIDKDFAVNYNCDTEGVDINYKALSKAVASMRETGKIKSSWRESIDKDYESRDKNRK